MKLIGMCVLGVMGAASAISSGAILVDYNSLGQSAAAASWPTNVVDANLTGNPVTRGAGIVAESTGSNRFGATGFDLGATLDTSNNDYFKFGFNVPAGNSATVTDLRFVLARTGSSTVGPQSAQCYYTTDAGATLTAIGSTITVGTGLGVSTFAGLNISVASGQTIEFRIYGWNAGSAAGAMRMLDDNVTTDPKAVQVLGSTTPAPGAAALVAMGGLMAGRRRRRS